MQYGESRERERERERERNRRNFLFFFLAPISQSISEKEKLEKFLISSHIIEKELKKNQPERTYEDTRWQLYNQFGIIFFSLEIHKMHEYCGKYKFIS